MQSFSAVSSAGLSPPTLPAAEDSAGDGSRIPPAPPAAKDSASMPPPAPPAAKDSASMPPPAPPRASTKVTSSGQGLRVSSSVKDYALPLPTLAMKCGKPGVGAGSLAAELALARRSSLRGSQESLSTRYSLIYIFHFSKHLLKFYE